MSDLRERLQAFRDRADREVYKGALGGEWVLAQLDRLLNPDPKLDALESIRLVAKKASSCSCGIRSVTADWLIGTVDKAIGSERP